MNKEIIKLAEESGLCKAFYYLGKDNNFVFEKLIPINDDCTIPVEKFAELIIKECANLAKILVMDISNYRDAEFVEKDIKEYFGIKND